jgi:hypothetical protein
MGKIQFELEINYEEIKEIYNALCNLNISIREDKQKQRVRFVQKLIGKWERIMRVSDESEIK